MIKSTPKEVFETYKKRFIYFPEYKIQPHPESNLKYVIVIPCCDESGLLLTLNSLLACDAPTVRFEVLIVVNHSVNTSEEVKQVNLKTIESFNKWNENNTSDLKFYCVEALDLPPKKAGVGLARKIGMDIAASRFAVLGKIGWVINLDADCLVSKNYLTEIEKNIVGDVRGGHFYFEHDLDTIENYELKLGIALYELHLRYYAQALKQSGFEYWHHTVGSCMITRSDAYALQGGMNQRKAGEDFYFMHKIMPGGDMITLHSAIVYPSARISNRVPFGTGKAQGDWINSENKTRLSYSFDLFKPLTLFFSNLETWYDSEPELDPYLNTFLETIEFKDSVARIKKRSPNKTIFKKNITQFCDGFFTLKLVHHLRDAKFGERDVVSESNALLSKLTGTKNNKNAFELLNAFRELDKYSD